MIQKSSLLREYKERQKGPLYTVPTQYESFIQDTANVYIKREIEKMLLYSSRYGVSSNDGILRVMRVERLYLPDVNGDSNV